MTFAVAAAFGGSAAAAPSRLTASDRHQIGTLIDRFTKDVVLRRDLADGWKLSGPWLRGGTTRAAWLRGTGVTVAAFPAAGSDFSDAWTLDRVVSPTEAELSVILHPRAGTHGVDETAFAVDVHKIAGRWLVNGYYSAATFGKNGVVGPNDFKMFRFDSSFTGASVKSQQHWLVVVLSSIGGVILLTLAAVYTRVKLRQRRAWASYTRHT
ncbi:MAG TPA: hypothetical protein VJP39_02310 [Gaiellaceae bacterium]|nr:hypothetical protein [Gaiellaceae bacterium]